MKTICYIQLVPTYSRGGHLTGVSAKQLTRKHPLTQLTGARLVRMEINVPDDAFKATQVAINIPLEKLTTQATATVQ